ncbi:GntR family transcriptional regulator [Streptomyces sp. 3MP-14]|uniref:GntR family transcriptional regulator n=1 Tax=Streptomyces mimosae TaxID=2586635 RepID=A0A5N6AGT0_9ACTN|nr:MULTISPECIES: GntR family transcriptional regulator [Streptomyces]KAB8167914.1 GntR family transcriptional regulator [Streptomyces mimosae]KAB8177438.1 GntR family transcriptional regulator [Streptomyces sp. 3MP-14]
MRISAHTVCTAIRDDIVAGVLLPGARLAEEQLAQRYGVSRVPVREALRTLESEGFVVSRRHAGACVAQLGDREAADLLDVRALVEPLGAARAAQRRTEAHLKVLRGLVRLGRQRAGQGQESDLRSLGDWFHETVAQATCSPGLSDLLVQLRRKITWLYTAEPLAGAVALWQERGALVDAIARGDAERARALSAAQLARATPARRQFHAAAPAAVGAVSTRKPAVNTVRGQI